MSKGKQASEGSVTVSQGNTSEREVQAKTYDEAAVAERMGRLNEAIRQKKEAEKVRADELSKIAARDEDVAVVAKELGLSNADAATRLRQAKGDLNALLRDYIGLPRRTASAAATA